MTALLLSFAWASSAEPVLSVDPSRGTTQMNMLDLLNGCFKQPTSLELDLRNYQDDLDLTGPLTWRQAGSPITTWTSNEVRHQRNVESALRAYNGAVSNAKPIDPSKSWSPLLFDDGVVHHTSTSGFVHTCNYTNETRQPETIRLGTWVHGCVQQAAQQGEEIRADMRGLHGLVEVDAGETVVLFDELKRLPHPWHFICDHQDAVGSKPARDRCYLGSVPTYFVNDIGRNRILESYARTGPTGCDGLP